ncbi:MAG: hypothetical protein ACLTL4_10260 [Hominisplanchenecus sp.]|uniref:hypothetical protein n=1 Tax=Hominisplanchenecus sp. TaxID=3038130 RepID=UPI00399493C8
MIKMDRQKFIRPNRQMVRISREKLIIPEREAATQRMLAGLQRETKTADIAKTEKTANESCKRSKQKYRKCSKYSSHRTSANEAA